MPMMQEVKPAAKKKPEAQQPDMVKKLQEAAMEQRKKDLAAEEEKKKNKGKVNTAPTEGVLSRMYKLFMGGDSEKK